MWVVALMMTDVFYDYRVYEELVEDSGEVAFVLNLIYWGERALRHIMRTLRVHIFLLEQQRKWLGVGGRFTHCSFS